MNKIQHIEFKITKTDFKKIDITLFTEEGMIKASLTCKDNKSLGSSFICDCAQDRKEFYKKLLTPIFSQLVKYQFHDGCRITGDFHRASLDRTVTASTQDGDCLFRGSSQYCFQTKRSVLNLKCMRSGSSIQSSDKIDMISTDVQHIGVVFDGVFYGS